MSEENDSLIGFDPLAWMKEDGEEAPAGPPAAETAPEPAVESAAAEPPGEPLQAEAAVAESSPAEAPVEPSADEGVIALGEVLDIAHVAGLYEQLSEALRAGREPALDASQLERVDAAGLQLLAAYSRELAGHGGAVQWRGEPAAALRDAAALLALQETLGLAA